MRRLGIFVPSLLGGGTERVASILAAGFMKRGHAVDLLLARREGPYLSAIPPGVRIIHLRKRGVLSCLPQLVRYLRRERPDALLSAMSHTNVVTLLASRLAGCPTRVVVSERSSFSECRRNYRSPRDRLIRLLMRVTYRWADKVIVVADEMIEDLHRGIGLPRSRIVSVPNPVLPEDFELRSAEPIEDAVFDQDRPVVVAAGRLTFEKDFPTLIRAFALVRHRRDAALVILGEGPEREALEKLIAELGLAEHVFLPGFVDNPFPHLRAASVFALSSRFEGMPGVLLQAMACGTPVVSTDCRSGPREILGEGVWGALVPVGDPVRLADALMMSLGKKDHPDVRQGLDRYRVDSAIDSYLRVLLGDAETVRPAQEAGLAKVAA
jgi:glycosyltransferase involved in cell wall biosynthesis